MRPPDFNFCHPLSGLCYLTLLCHLIKSEKKEKIMSMHTITIFTLRDDDSGTGR